MTLVKVSELGEFGLIERLSAGLGAAQPTDLLIGIGDDCAAWRVGDQCLLATTDTLVEGVHFQPSASDWSDIGWKALAVNVSDVAAMGGEPLFGLVTLALPSDTEVRTLDSIYAGLGECAAEYGVTIAGGDIVRAGELMMTVSLIGRAQMREAVPLLMRRDRAKVGDVVAVTGTLGDSAAGLRRLREGGFTADELTRAHTRPRPPLLAAQEAARLGIRCAIDVSDGLIQDLSHICEASGVGADIRADDLPISEAVRSNFLEDSLSLACAGGEDYQIVLVGASGLIQAMIDLRPTEVTAIGRITENAGSVRLLDKTGAEVELSGAGWDHLRTEVTERS
jgi:thiamine-monophosphate kinase